MILFEMYNYKIKIGQIGATDCTLVISRNGKEKELFVEDDDWLKIDSALTRMCREIDAILDKDKIIKGGLK